MSEIESRVKAIIIEKFGVSESMVTSEANFTNDLSADSLDRVELIMEIEDEFGISIPEELAEKIATEGLSVRETEKLLKEEGAPAKRPAKRKAEKNADVKRVEEDLKAVLGTRVNLAQSGKKGKIEIEYYSGDELERIIDLFMSTR